MFSFCGVCNNKLAGLLLHSVRINTGYSSLVLVTSVVNMLRMAVLVRTLSNSTHTVSGLARQELLTVLLFHFILCPRFGIIKEQLLFKESVKFLF